MPTTAASKENPSETIQNAVRYLIQNYSPSGNKVGWLMMASILVEAWDLYSIAFVLIFIREQYNPDPFMLGLAAAATQGGALVGALIGGWLSDKIGRRVMFLITMVLFIILALAQSIVTSVGMLVVIRFLLGVPLGSDISTGYTYIMESMAKGEREIMGNRWQFMFALGEILLRAAHRPFIDFNAKPGSVGRLDVAALDGQWRGSHILGESTIGQGQAPGEIGRHSGKMQRRGRCHARLAGLARNVDLHAEAVAKPASFEQRPQPAKLDSFQTHAGRRLAFVMTLDVVERMDAFIGADRDGACGSNPRHAG